MTSRARCFVITSLLTVLIAVGISLAVVYSASSGRALLAADSVSELQFVPPGATLVAFADVRAILASDPRLLVGPTLLRLAGQEQFRKIGIDIETDLDRVIGCLSRPPGGGQDGESAALVLARGRFDRARIESSMRAQGATVSDEKGVRLITFADSAARSGGLALGFVEPGLVGIGSTALVRGAVSLKQSGNGGAANVDLMNLVRSLEAGSAWAVGRPDTIASHVALPPGLADQPITWLAASAQLDEGLNGLVRAEMRDGAAADNLRDVARALVALAGIQSGSRPDLQPLVRSLEVGGSGTTVTLAFHLPPEALGTLGDGLTRGDQKAR